MEGRDKDAVGHAHEADCPLGIAALHDNDRVARALIEAGEDVNSHCLVLAQSLGSPSIDTPLLIAAYYRQFTVLRLLLDAGAEVPSGIAWDSDAAPLIHAAERAGTKRAVAKRFIKEGDAAYGAGDHGGAFEAYRQALSGQWLDGQDFSRARERCVTLGSAAPLPLPEEAKRHMVIGMTLAKDAKNAEDYDKAAEEMRQAIDAAPWWATGYFDLAKVEEGKKDYAGAIRDLKLYLLGSPKADDARQVQNHIYVLEAKKTEGPR